MRLLCPRTGLPLAAAGGRLVTPDQEQSYPVRHGVPVIRASAAHDRGLFAERLDELAALLERDDWRAALLDWTGGSVDGFPLHQALANENTAAWKVLMPPPARGRLLYVSARLGCEPLALGRWCDEVVACNPNLGHAVFVAARARQLGLANVHAVCAGDTTTLPFPTASFDAVVLNGLDWLRPRQRSTHLAFLREIRRLLKDEAHLWLGAENRWGFTHWLGRADIFTGQRSHALLPRVVTDLWARLRHRPPAAPTYGRRGFRRLLAEAGFQASRFYAAPPHYRRPAELVSLDPGNEGQARDLHLRARFHRHPRFAASFAIVAGARRAEASWLEGLIAAIGRRLGVSPHPSFPRVVVSGAAAAGLIVFIERDMVVRLPLQPDSLARVERNYEGLLHVRALRAGIGVDTPEPLLRDHFGGVPFTVEQHLAGRMLDVLAPSARPFHESRMMDLLFSLQRVGFDGEVDAAAQWRETVVAPFRRAIAWGRDAGERSAIEDLAAVAADTDPTLVPLTLSHGDFKWNNMLVTELGRNLALFDWDRWSPHEMATHDFLHFVVNRRRTHRQRPWADMLAEWLAGEGADDLEQHWTERFEAHAELGAGWRAPAALGYWARTTAVVAGTDYDLNRPWIRANFLALLPHLRAAVAQGAVR